MINKQNYYKLKFISIRIYNKTGIFKYFYYKINMLTYNLHFN